jgi:hypothetical protein
MPGAATPTTIGQSANPAPVNRQIPQAEAANPAGQTGTNCSQVLISELSQKLFPDKGFQRR